MPSKTRNVRDNIFQALTFSLGVYLGMFYGYVITQVSASHETSVLLTEYSSAYGLSDYAFTYIINECSMLSNTVLTLIAFGVVALIVLLFVFKQSTQILGKRTKLGLVAMAICVSVWLIAPVAVMMTATRNSLIYVTLRGDAPQSVLAQLSQYYRALDLYRDFAKTFIVQMKVLILILTIYSLCVYIVQRSLINKRVSLSLRGLFFLIPILAYFALELIFPVAKGSRYVGEKISFALGGTGIIGPTVPIEPFLTWNSILILASMILFFIILARPYKQRLARRRN